MKIPKTLQQSIDAVNESVATSQRSEAALASEVSTLATAQGEAQALELTLQGALTAESLGEPAGDMEAIRSRLADAEKKLVEGTRRVAGLESRIKQNHAQLQRVGIDYQREFVEFRQQVMVEQFGAALKAFEGVRHVIAIGMTIAQALNDPSYALVMTKAYLPDPGDLNLNLLNPINREHSQMPAWFGDSELTALYEDHVQLTSMGRALEMKMEKLSDAQKLYDDAISIPAEVRQFATV